MSIMKEANNTIAFSPCEELQPEGGFSHVHGLYQDMMNLFDNEIALVINDRLSAAFSGDYQEQDVVNQVMGVLVDMDIRQNTLHDYLSLYNIFLRAVDTYAKERGDGYLFHRKTKSVIINS